MAKQFQVALPGETYVSLSRLAQREHRTKGGMVAAMLAFYAKNFAQKQNSENQKQEANNG
jgi:hypothetical protein